MLSLVANAASFTATVEAYNRAALSGDVPDHVSVAFINDGGSKGQVSKDHSATLKLSNWPEATIQKVTLYVHSNKSAGAAAVYMSLGDSTWQVASGNFNEWPGIGAYSSEEDVPLVALSQSTHIDRDSSILVQIQGWVNSIYWQKIVVDYTITPPSPHIVTLQYPSTDGLKRLVLNESKAQEGVILPSVPQQDSVLADGGVTWYWYGWSEQPVTLQSSSPLCWQAGDWYGPEEDVTLYALYTNHPVQTLRQDTSYASNEYALMYVGLEDVSTDRPMLLTGNWSSGQIPLTDVDMVTSLSYGWEWSIRQLSDTFRYNIHFFGDSLTIQNVATKSYLGHTSSTGTNKSKPYSWAWLRVGDGTILIYSAIRSTNTQQHVTCLSTDMADIMSNRYVALYREDTFVPTYAYWHLFATANIPTRTEASYSTLPQYVALPQISTQTPATKTLDQQGRVCIHTNQLSFTILGISL